MYCILCRPSNFADITDCSYRRSGNSHGTANGGMDRCQKKEKRKEQTLNQLVDVESAWKVAVKNSEKEMSHALIDWLDAENM